jgi:hypothetical protein
VERQNIYITTMQTQNDSVIRFVALRDALIKERGALQKRLQQIDAALGNAAVSSPASAAPSRASKPAPGPAPTATGLAKKRGRPPRSGNGMSIREAVTKVTSKKPMGLSELVAAVERIGYKFESTNPRNSVGAYLYSPYGKKYFRRVDGKFSPLK